MHNPIKASQKLIEDNYLLKLWVHELEKVESELKRA
jgi:hypothetical protein